VHDAGPMRLRQAVEDVNTDLQKVRKSQRAFAQTLRKCLALQILHHQKIGSVLMANIVQGANVRMIESRDMVRGLPVQSAALVPGTLQPRN